MILTRARTFDLLITALDSLPLGSARLMRGGSLNYIGCWDDNKVVCHFILLGLKSCQNERIPYSLHWCLEMHTRTKMAKHCLWFGRFGDLGKYNSFEKIFSRSPNFAEVLKFMLVATLAKQSCKCISDETQQDSWKSQDGRMRKKYWVT